MPISQLQPAERQYLYTSSTDALCCGLRTSQVRQATILALKREKGRWEITCLDAKIVAPSNKQVVASSKYLAVLLNTT